MNWVLVYGCGTLAYGCEKPSRFGTQWSTGRLPEPLVLEERVKKSAQRDSVAVSLTEALDQELAWTPRLELPESALKGKVGRDKPYLTPILPSWKRLAKLEVERIAKQLRGGGVLVTPEAWRQTHRGRTFLRPWAEAGWRWAPLEEVLHEEFTKEPRFVTGGRAWLRVSEPSGSAIVPSDAAAALAHAAAPLLLGRILQSAPPNLAQSWRDKEQKDSQWFTLQQIARLLAEALREEKASVEIGGEAAPLFLFSSSAARKRLKRLTGLRMTVDLAPLSSRYPVGSWWERVSESEFLKPPANEYRRPGFNWRDRDTVIVSTPSGLENVEHRSGTEFLLRYLKMKSRGPRQADPAELRKALEIGSDLKSWLSRSEKDMEATRNGERGGPAEAEVAAGATGTEARETGTEEVEHTMERALPDTEEPAAQPTRNPLDGFRLDHIRLDLEGRPEVLAVQVDGEPVPDGGLVPADSEDEGIYRLDRVPVRHGSIVRIDFEPARKR